MAANASSSDVREAVPTTCGATVPPPATSGPPAPGMPGGPVIQPPCVPHTQSLSGVNSTTRGLNEPKPSTSMQNAGHASSGKPSKQRFKGKVPCNVIGMGVIFTP